MHSNFAFNFNLRPATWAMMFLDSVGVTLSAVWGLLGLGGVAVSLGLKDVVSDLVAGLIMLTNPTFKVGDMHVICDGHLDHGFNPRLLSYIP